MKISIDRRIFNDSVISKAVYWLSGDCNIARLVLDDHTEELSISILPDSNMSENDIEVKLNQALHDFKLRQIVADETRDIKTILYAKAFAEDEELSEEDIHD